MDFQDQELMALEQLFSVDKGLFKKYGVSYTKPVPGDTTVGEYLDGFSEEVLLAMEKGEEDDRQYAAIIRYLQQNEEMLKLQYEEPWVDPETGTYLANSFTHPDHPGEAIVSFNGTAISDHWYDNGTGLGTADTEGQLEAYKYVSGMDYENITVVGHSKGGNMSQYVTVRCDNVDRCVSMDGQGFSREFLDKYWAEIEMNGGKITNYSLQGDYVHILLYPVPGSEQKYCEGDMVENAVENHFANSFFKYETVLDENGNTVTVIVLDENGLPYVNDTVAEDPMMTYLHEFTCFVLSTMPQEERVLMGEYVGNLLRFVPELNAGRADIQDVLGYLLSDQEMFAKFLAYLIRYAEFNNLSEEEFLALLNYFGLGELWNVIEQTAAENPDLVDAGESLLAFFMKQLHDGKEDKFVKWLLSLGNDAVNEYLRSQGINIQIDLGTVWQNVEDEYHAIPTPPPTATQNVQSKTGRTYDYTQTAYDALMETIRKVAETGTVDVSQWKQNSGEKWYIPLLVGVFAKGLQQFNAKVRNTNNTAKLHAQQVFDAVSDADQDYAGKLQSSASTVRVLTAALR